MNFSYVSTPLLLAIATLLISCNSSPPPKELAKMTPEAECIANNGEWKRLTRGGSPTCNEKFADGGKACNDGATCQSGTCLAPRDSQGPAQCASTTSAVIHAGCTGGKMVNGKVVPVGCP